MSQKLSAMNYIKNNKRRVAVPIISLCLCFLLTYLTGFLLSTTEMTFTSIFIDKTQKIQFINLSDSTLGIEKPESTDPEDIDAYIKKRNQIIEKLAEKLKKHNGVKKVYTEVYSSEKLEPAIGRAYDDFPLTDKETVSEILKDFGADLAEGKLPENPGEIVIDRSGMKNNRCELGDYYNYDEYRDKYKIVGILDTDMYFACGIPAKNDSKVKSIFVFSNINDIEAELKSENITISSKDTIGDYKNGIKLLKTNVKDVIGNSTSYIFGGIMIILTILLTVVYTLYLRERHDEWCLYYSIGFSRKSIYLSVMKELLFTFLTALTAGAVLIGISVWILYYIMIEPFGIKCLFFDSSSVFEILCSYVFLLGILHIPIYYALVKIRTIDALENDLY